jgi:nucleotide-binding universal stress UspA family protein
VIKVTSPERAIRFRFTSEGKSGDAWKSKNVRCRSLPGKVKEMKVLIALDAGPESAEIVREAASRPWPAKSQFILLHVLDPYPFGKMPISLERAKNAVRAQLQAAAEALVQGGWKMEVDVVFGRARQVISKVAKSWKADFVFVGSSGEGALMRVLLGSTARSVLRQAPCSIEVVRPLEKSARRVHQPGLRVLIATDGSEFSLAAIRSVAKRPWPKGSTFRVIAIPEPFMPLSQFPFELKEIEKLNTAVLKDAKRYAAAGAEVLARAGLKVREGTPLPTDSDGKEIVKEAKQWHADLIVVGSHGRRGFDRMTIGSVSEHVAFHAQCSVEVIR